MERKSRFICLVFVTASFIFFTSSGCKKNEVAEKQQVASLHVPFIPQIASELCWAACTQMVSTYYNQKINHLAPALSQCDVVKLKFNDSINYQFDCDTLQPANFPADYNVSGAPFPVEAATGTCMGYTPTFYVEPIGKNIMPQDTIVKYIGMGMPIIFGWGWQGITIASVSDSNSHYMVAEGVPKSSYISDHIWISVNDPWPVGRGKHRIMAYSEFSNRIPTSIPPSEYGSDQYVFSSHTNDWFLVSYPGKGK